MARSTTFGRKLGGGFAIVVALGLASAAVAIYALRSVVAAKDRVIAVYGQQLIAIERFAAAFHAVRAAGRGFLADRDPRFMDELAATRGEAKEALARLDALVDGADERDLASEIRSSMEAHDRAYDKVADLRRTDAPMDAVMKEYRTEPTPHKEACLRALRKLADRAQRLLDDGKKAASDTADLAVNLVGGAAAAGLLAAVGIAFVLTRALTTQIGSAVGQVRSSTAELQATAAQQASASKEHATTTTEVATTTKELLATTRQIAESAQRVAKIAEDTAGAAQSGDRAVQLANEAIGRIKRQVDLVVTHMLDLGRKSQQIGGILEMINELAEQTNILAINATIESAGAGEAGKRFAVVADEIRKLADRVGGSSKEVRSLVDEIRAASNTTVMATEDGSKAVDAGTRQFAEVATSFRRIADLVATTTDAAREIEISARQQTSAVEQVNLAITEVATVAKDTESGSRQTLDASAQLVALARELATLVESDGAGASRETVGARR